MIAASSLQQEPAVRQSYAGEVGLEALISLNRCFHTELCEQFVQPIRSQCEPRNRKPHTSEFLLTLKVGQVALEPPVAILDRRTVAGVRLGPAGAPVGDERLHLVF